MTTPMPPVPISTAPSIPTPSPSTTSVSPAPTADMTTTRDNGPGADVFVSSAVFAAVVAAAVNVALARHKDKSEERARLRKHFAEAFEVAMQYKEFPYAIRRRRADEPAAERVRLSNDMRAVQAKLSYFVVWTEGESHTVGKAYSELVAKLRQVAGKECNEAWKQPAAQHDADMNIPSTTCISCDNGTFTGNRQYRTVIIRSPPGRHSGRRSRTGTAS